MGLSSIAALLAASIAGYVAFYHVTIYIRNPKSRADLTFALTAFSIFCYDIFCAGLYNSTSVEEGGWWQYWQVVSMMMAGIFFLLFIAEYFQLKHGKFFKGILAFNIIILLSVLTLDKSYTWLNAESIKVIDVFGLSVTYFEQQPGVLADVQMIVGLLAFLYAFIAAFSKCKEGFHEKACPLIFALVVFFASVANDVMVSQGIYNFVYTIEFGFFALVCAMAYSLQNQVLKAARMDEELRIAHDVLEEEFRNRTIELREAYTRLKSETDDKEQARAGLIRAERMAAVGTLAGGVAHEFNNINTAILGFSELLVEDAEGHPEIVSSVMRIRNAALRAKAITGKLLTFSGQKRGNYVSANLSQIADETLALVLHEFETEGVVVIRNFADVPDSIMDVAEIGQVALNFIINAKHALTAREKKSIIISTGATDEQVWLKVEDSGCGIQPDNLKKIFTPFYSTKGEHSEEGSPLGSIKGTGLGLSVCHTIIEEHGGEIQVESEVDSGSVFTVTLPLVSAVLPRDEVDDETDHLAIRRSGNVIIVDDEPDVRDVLHHILKRVGYCVRDTDDGNEALEWIEQGDIALVLIDIHMPKMSGAKLIEKIRQMPQPHPACLIVSGRDIEANRRDYGDLIESLETITKPFTLEQLVIAAAKAIERA